jgi:site-specific recombinase XerD
MDVMKEYLDARSDPGATVLFISHAKTRPEYRGKPLSRYGAWRVVDRAARDIGLAHVHPHDFRHWRATDLLRKGVQLDQVRKFLNHSSISVTEMYAKTAEKEVDNTAFRTSPLFSKTIFKRETTQEERSRAKRIFEKMN